jgi:hypothetical protein
VNYPQQLVCTWCPIFWKCFLMLLPFHTFVTKSELYFLVNVHGFHNVFIW